MEEGSGVVAGFAGQTSSPLGVRHTTSPRSSKNYDEKSIWSQRELLASQTLTDLAKNCRNLPHAEEDPFIEEIEEKPVKQTTAGDGSWAHYVPPSYDTSSTLKSIDQTEQSVLSIPAPSKALGGMMDIAHALDGINCEPQKRRTEYINEMTLAPKPKKRRRRRHEIVRNFKCPESNCTKSYGSEGALKTHIRLKHVENPNLLFAAGSLRKVSLPEENTWTPNNHQSTAGSFPMDFPRLPPISALAGDVPHFNQPMQTMQSMQPMNSMQSMQPIQPMHSTQPTQSMAAGPPVVPYGAMNFEFVLNQPQRHM